MALITNKRLIGVNASGHFTGDDPGAFTDTAWGNTTQDGVQIQLATTNAELQSGQAKMLESVSLVSANISLVFAFVVSELQVFQRLWGMVTGDLAGGLSGGTPVAEKLTVGQASLGAREERLYVEGPGPASTRTARGFRCRVSDLGGMSFASNAYQTPGATWAVLNPEDSNPPFTIEDAV